MAVDNILYPENFILDIDVTNSGSITNVLFFKNTGIELNINQTHSGSATNIIYKPVFLQNIPSGVTEVSYTF